MQGPGILNFKSPNWVGAGCLKVLAQTTVRMEVVLRLRPPLPFSSRENLPDCREKPGGGGVLQRGEKEELVAAGSPEEPLPISLHAGLGVKVKNPVDSPGRLKF